MNIESLARQVFEDVFRHGHQAPGFAVIEFEECNSTRLRRMMVELKTQLGVLLEQRDNKQLCYAWLGRFAQQESTPFHRDNAGDSSVLMLGYEPTKVKSTLKIADYSRFVEERKITSDDFFLHYNPIFVDIEDQLSHYVTELETTNHFNYRIVLINNSILGQKMKGVMHQATITSKDPTKSRIVNSIMMNVEPLGTNDSLTSEQRNFIDTKEIS